MVAVGLVLLALVVGAVLLTRGDGATEDASQSQSDSGSEPSEVGGASSAESDGAGRQDEPSEQSDAAGDEPSAQPDPMADYQFLMARAWRGTAESWNTGKQYQLVLRLDDSSGFPIPGSVAMTSASGRTGRWEVLAYESPNGLDVQPGAWITNPGGDWSRDYMTLSWSDEFSLGTELTGEDSPGQPWGSATLE